MDKKPNPPRFRITVELVDEGDRDGGRSAFPLRGYDLRRGMILGDMWLGGSASSFTFEVSSPDFYVALGDHSWRNRP